MFAYIALGLPMAVAALGLLTLLWQRQFSAQARYRRRRGRNYRPVKDRRRVPAVQLNAKAKHRSRSR